MGHKTILCYWYVLHHPPFIHHTGQHIAGSVAQQQIETFYCGYMWCDVIWGRCHWVRGFCVVILRLPKSCSPLSCKDGHNITACICTERRKKPWFDCDQRYCIRPCTNISQLTHNLKCYPEFRYIDSGRECLRQWWWSHRDQHYESGISVSLPWMYNHIKTTAFYF